MRERERERGRERERERESERERERERERECVCLFKLSSIEVKSSIVSIYCTWTLSGYVLITTHHSRHIFKHTLGSLIGDRIWSSLRSPSTIKQQRHILANNYSESADLCFHHLIFKHESTVTECPNGTFGHNCTQACSEGCADVCYKVTGSSTRRPDWQGTSCDRGMRHRKYIMHTGYVSMKQQNVFVYIAL